MSDLKIYDFIIMKLAESETGNNTLNLNDPIFSHSKFSCYIERLGKLTIEMY